MTTEIVEIPIKYIGQDTLALVTAWSEGKELQGEYKFCLVKLDTQEITNPNGKALEIVEPIR